MKFAIIKSGGKQYFVKESGEVVVDYAHKDKDEEIEFETLAEGDIDKKTIELGKPFLKKKVKGTILENMKGEKLRISRFKSKVRHRKVMGFRPLLSKVRISSI